MGGFAKQSAAAYLDLGPFVSSADGKTRLTSLSLLQADVRLSKNGGTMAAKSHASACSHLSAGVYRCPLNATDFNTPGRLRVEAVHASALAVWETITVLPANIYDSLIGGTDTIEVDLTHVLGVLQTTSLNHIRTNTSAIAAKLPSKSYLAGTNNSDGDVQASEMTGNFPGSVASVTGAVGSVTGNVGGNVAGSVGSVVTKTDFELTAAYDAAKTAAQRSALSAVAAKLDSVKIDTSAVAAKLPSKSYLAGTNNSDGDVQASEMTGNFPGSVASVTGAVGSVTGNVGGNVAGSVGSVVTKTDFELTAAYDAAKTAAQRSALSAVAAKLDSVKIDTSAVAAVDFGALTSAIASMDTAALSELTEVLGSLDTSALASLPTAQQIRAEMETAGSKLERVHRRLFGKVTMTSGVLRVYDDTGTLVVTTQILNDDGTTQTQGAAT